MRFWTLPLAILASAAGAVMQTGPGWRPISELEGATFQLGQGKGEGVKVKGYEGEWPLWSSERLYPPAADKPPDGQAYVCQPAGECTPCPSTYTFKTAPYCLPYNNRRAVVCTPVAKGALSIPASPSGNLTGYEACGKVVVQEARDLFEFLTCVALIAVASVSAFVHRQRILYARQSSSPPSRRSRTRT